MAKNKGGRPQKVWSEEDIELFKSLCRIFCTEQEICSVMGLDNETLVDMINRYLYEDITGHKKRGKAEKVSFPQAFKRYSAYGKKSLRRVQFEQATNGNVTMLIWLGKQYLGQSDSPEDNIDIEDTEGFFSQAGL